VVGAGLRQTRVNGGNVSVASPVPIGPASSDPGSEKVSHLTLAGLILAVSMNTIDQTIVALSAPTIQQELGLSHSGMQWAVNVYLLTMAAVFLLGGRLADVWGHKKMVLVGTGGFAFFSLLCGLAPAGDLAEAWLVASRALQGACGALMFPAAIGMVVQTYPKQRRAEAMAAFFAITGAMTAVGPIAGGFLMAWTWRSIFWINIPIAIAAMIIVIVSASPTPAKRERIDWTGAVLVAVGMIATVFGLQQASTWGWSSIGVWGSLLVGAVLLVGFGLFERRVAQPLVKLQAFKDRSFALSVFAILASSAAFLAAFYFLSVYAQVALRLSATLTGLLFLEFFIGFVIAAQLGARVFDRAGARPVLFFGGLAGVIGFAWLAIISTTLIDRDGAGAIIAQAGPLILAGAGIGLMSSAASTDAVNRAIGASYGEVSAITQTMKNFGGSIGIAVLVTLVTTQLTSNLSSSIIRLGGSAEDARDTVNAITRAGGDVSSDSLSGLPQRVQDEILSAVQADYANAAQWAFYGMAVAMAIVLVLALLYPRGRPAKTAHPHTADENASIAAA
jgi:EmrB/QacA subfamily drug resistance transporter